MRIHFLGTGEALPTAERQNTMLLCEFDQRAVLVDCNGTPIRSILRAGCRLDHVSDVILTHSHVDHLYALPSLLHGLWLCQDFPRDQPIRLHGLRETLNMADNLINVFGLRAESNPIQIELVRVDPVVQEKLVLDCGDWVWRAFGVKHGAMPALGLCLTHADAGNLVFSGDAVVCETTRAHLTRDTRILIHDCGGGLAGNPSHAGAKEINQMIRHTTIERVYLTHLPAFLSESARLNVQAYASRDFAGAVILPADGDVAELAHLTHG
ncbi:MAG: MBL fold metallo-hydrolase [Chloroflexi bacterium]|nr:MBL fold metallo-hydrolase [Chloroflexota bacterium]